MDDLENTKAIIFDLRICIFHTTFFTNYLQRKSNPDLDYPGKFIWTEMGESGNDLI